MPKSSPPAPAAKAEAIAVEPGSPPARSADFVYRAKPALYVKATESSASQLATRD